MPRIGIDLGGTKIEAIALSDDGQELYRRRIATPAGDYDATLAAIAGLIGGLEEDLGETASIGIATPGALSPASGLMRNANSVCLNGRPLDRDLTARLGRPIRMANDADCFALSEALDGAAAGADSVFGVIIGTGTGGAVVINGQLLSGPNAIAGEWGHNPLPWPHIDELPGPHCYCGRRGCIETHLSGPGLSRDHLANTGERLTAEAIAAAAVADDPGAAASLDRYLDRLARGLASVINVLDPQVIVLGGGLSRIEAIYHEVPSRWGDHVFSDIVRTRLLPPRHGDASGVRGAARLWPA